eukprot:12519113-Alexandrium_andersonii.AAC.1
MQARKHMRECKRACLHACVSVLKQASTNARRQANTEKRAGKHASPQEQDPPVGQHTTRGHVSTQSCKHA